MTGFLVIGEALVDVVRDRDGSVTERPGGSPLNVAVGLGRLGRDVRLLTSLGGDARGDVVSAHLAASHVVVESAGRAGVATSSATAVIAADGSARYEFDLDWDLREAPTPQAAVVHTGSLAAALAPGDEVALRAVAVARGSSLVSFDPNIRAALMRPHRAQVPRTERFFAVADVVKLSDEDAEWLYPGVPTDAVVDRILALGPALVSITLGAAGALVATRNHRSRRSADSTGLVDTIGAGDSFMAGLLHGLAGHLERDGLCAVRDGGVLTRDALESLADLASACSSITVRRRGADLPWASELAGVVGSRG